MVDKVNSPSHFFMSPDCRICISSDSFVPLPLSGADLHGERRGGAAAVEAHRQPGDSDQ